MIPSGVSRASKGKVLGEWLKNGLRACAGCACYTGVAIFSQSIQRVCQIGTSTPLLPQFVGLTTIVLASLAAAEGAKAVEALCGGQQARLRRRLGSQEGYANFNGLRIAVLGLVTHVLCIGSPGCFLPSAQGFRGLLGGFKVHEMPSGSCWLLARTEDG
eukprot:scaffold171_cov263-Pinguiococcus_pyrenoidosus.AAC.5